MNIKLNRSELLSLRQLFVSRVEPLDPANSIDRLVVVLLKQVYNRLWAKGPNPAPGSLKLSEAEAIAFWAFWTAQELPLTMMFEQNMLRQINTKIHQTLQL